MNCGNPLFNDDLRRFLTTQIEHMIYSGSIHYRLYRVIDKLDDIMQVGISYNIGEVSWTDRLDDAIYFSVDADYDNLLINEQ